MQSPRLRPVDRTAPPGDVVRRDRIAPRPTPRPAPPASGPRLNPPRVGTTPRINPIVSNPIYDRSTWAGSNRWHWGSWGFGAHCSVFGWNRARWGCYSFPFWYSGWCSNYWFDSWRGRWSWWNSCAPSYIGASLGTWWSPASCYLPGAWLGFGPFGSYGLSTFDWGYYPPASTTVIYASAPAVVESAPEVVVVEPEPAAEPSPAAVDPGKELEDRERRVADDLRTIADRHLRLGDYYFRQARFDEAAESYVRALAYVPDDGAAHFVVADALFAIGDYHYAAYMIRKGLSFAPDLAGAVADKREFYGDAKLFDEHLAALVKYCGEKPYDAAARLVLGYNQLFSGDREAAMLSFRRVLELEPGDNPARLFLEALSKSADVGAKSATGR